MRLLAAFYYSEKERTPFSLEQHITRLLYLLSKYCTQDERTVQVRPPAGQKLLQTDNNYINYILDTISKDYGQPLSLNRLAKQAFVSASYLSRLFKEETGLGFSQYLKLYRLEQAARRLRTSAESIAKIATDCGFEGISNFNRQFKQTYSLTPREYAVQNRADMHAGSHVRPDRIYVLNSTESTRQIARFLAGRQSAYGRHSVGHKEICLFPQPKQTHPAAKLQVMLNTSSALNLLLPEHRAQIDAAAAEMNVKYVRIDGFFSSRIATEMIPASAFPDSDSVMRFLLQRHITPIFVIQKNDLVSGSLYDLLHHCQIYFDAPEILLELSVETTTQFPYEEYESLFHKTAEFSNVRCGLGLPLPEHGADTVSNCLQALSHLKISPAFISVSMRTERCMAQSYVTFEALSQHIKQAFPNTSLFVSSWNVQKKEKNPVGAYDFRAADILETVLSLSLQTNVLGFWLNNQLGTTGSAYEYMAMYYLGNIKRPVYFLLSFLNRLAHIPSPLQYGENYIAAVGTDRAAALIYLPYLREEYDSEADDRISNTVNVFLRISGLKPGCYYCKELTLDAVHGDPRPIWMESIGFADEIDQEMVAHMEHLNRPNIQVYSQNLAGLYEKNFDMNINDCKFILLLRK